MEVKINREIRNYTESMFFGLSLRQFVFSLLAVGVAVLLYFVLKPYVGTETVSWMCILGAAPFAAMGFVNYNGMTAEQFVWAWLRSEMLEPKQIKFEPVNIYYEALKDAIDEHEKEAYQNELDAIKDSVEYDALEMSGSRAVWPQVLSVYAVKTTSDPDNPQEVATITPEKEQLLKDLFWEMNEITHRTETKIETVIIETDDGNGNILEEEVQETITTLYIAVSHKTADEMAAQYGFNEDQKQQLAELLAQDSNMWAAVLYGIYGVDDQIVAVALSQVGNVGGEPYWSWYGFGSRVEWCACFVSWCANECGYIDTGVIPKFAGCVNGVQWFRERGQWADNAMEPSPGMIIFFDWDNKGSSGPQDSQSDHVGIVQKVENGVVYTIEGNSGDSCRVNQYPVGYYEILGYGVAAY